MPRDLFGDVVSPRSSVDAGKWYTVPLSLIAHVAVMVPLVLVPLLATDVLPAVPDLTVFVTGDVVPPEPPPPPRTVPPDSRPRANPEAAPTEAPDRIAPEPEVPLLPPSEPADTGVVGAVPGINTVITAAPPPPPPSNEPHRVGGKISPPVKVRHTPPVYPQIAQQARVQGTVVLQAIIDVDGRVVELKVLKSIPLLDQAAIDAVRQWEYSPTLLNEVPVRVIMSVAVTFTLQR
jgi:protein TonB